MRHIEHNMSAVFWCGVCVCVWVKTLKASDWLLRFLEGLASFDFAGCRVQFRPALMYQHLEARLLMGLLSIPLRPLEGPATLTTELDDFHPPKDWVVFHFNVCLEWHKDQVSRTFSSWNLRSQDFRSFRPVF